MLIDIAYYTLAILSLVSTVTTLAYDSSCTSDKKVFAALQGAVDTAFGMADAAETLLKDKSKWTPDVQDLLRFMFLGNIANVLEADVSKVACTLLYENYILFPRLTVCAQCVSKA